MKATIKFFSLIALVSFPNSIMSIEPWPEIRSLHKDQISDSIQLIQKLYHSHLSKPKINSPVVLLEAAEKSKEVVPLSLLLGQASYEAAIKLEGQYQAALDALEFMQSLEEKLSGKTLSLSIQTIRAWRKTNKQPKKLSKLLIQKYNQLSIFYESHRNYQKAYDLNEEIIKLTRKEQLPLSDFSLRQKKLSGFARSQKRLDGILKKIKSKPDDPLLNRQAFLIYVIEFEAFDLAVEHARKSEPESIIKFINLCKKPVTKITNKELFDLARWYEGLAILTELQFKNKALSQALRYYKAFINRSSRQDLKRGEALLRIGKVEELLGKPKVFRRLKGHVGKVRKFSFSSNGKYLGTADSNNLVLVWDHKQGELVRTFGSIKGKIRSLSFDYSGKLLAIDKGDFGTEVYDVKSGAKVFSRRGVKAEYNAVLSSNGKYVVTGGHYRMRLWNVNTNKQIRVHEESGYKVALSSQKKIYACGGWWSSIRVYSIPTGKKLYQLEGHNNHIYGLDLTNDGKYLASSGGSEAFVWKLSNKEIIHKFKVSKTIDSLTLSENVKRIALNTRGGGYVFDVSSGSKIYSLDHQAGELSLSPKGKFIAHGDGIEVLILELNDTYE